MSLATLFTVCVIAHVFVSNLISLPWLVPDLTLVGLVLVVGRNPRNWMPVSVVTGLIMSVFVVRGLPIVMVSYIALGLCINVASRQWNITDERLECGIVALASLLLGLGWVWLDDVWLPMVVGFSVIRAGLTASAAWGLRKLVPFQKEFVSLLQ